jgi:hypothetical protein
MEPMIIINASNRNWLFPENQLLRPGREIGLRVELNAIEFKGVANETE